MKPYIENLPLFGQGKVRDTFIIPKHEDLLLMVATDRLSTHNIVHNSLIPGKGMILNALSIFWTKAVLGDIPTHLVAYGKNIYRYLPGKITDYPEDLHLRAVVVKKLSILPYEFIWRARMAGSLYDIYSKGIKNPYGLEFHRPLQKMSLFETPVFTPTDKSETDDPRVALEVRLEHPEATNLTRRVYNRGRNYALKRGIDIIDFKGEVGKDKKGKFYIADEILTGDCCRFVSLSSIKLGEDPEWMDKEPFRIYAKEAWGEGKKVPLDFPPEIVLEGVARYITLFEVILEKSLGAFQKKLG